MEAKLKKRINHRLHILEGQIRGLGRMVEEGRYCPEILTQSLAARRSLESFQILMLENHFKTCVRKDIRSKQGGRVTKELLELYQRALKCS